MWKVVIALSQYTRSHPHGPTGVVSQRCRKRTSGQAQIVRSDGDVDRHVADNEVALCGRTARLREVQLLWSNFPGTSPGEAVIQRCGDNLNNGHRAVL
jgi:hypothetical protein